MTELIFSYLPVILLIILMTKRNNMPSYQALPLCAFIVYLLLIAVFQFELNLIHAKLISGALTALTPISIIAGAIFLFRCMEITGALDTIKAWLNTISSHPVAQLMIIGWAFAFLIEGVSGFGTPAAIAAPILFSLGFPALKVAIFCLIMNTIPVTFGAVGTPMWFGLSLVPISQETLSGIAFSSALLNTFAAPFVVIAGLMFVVDSYKTIIKNLLFILLSVFSCTLPFLLISYYSLEFPSLIGGLLGLILTVVFAKFSIGLEKPDEEQTPSGLARVSIGQLTKASFPIWGTVLLLSLTRIDAIGLKALLQLTEPSLIIELGVLGEFAISASLVLSLSNIFNTGEVWSHSLLYVPSILPFFLIGYLTMQWFQPEKLKVALIDTSNKMLMPSVALVGALIFVNLMMAGGLSSPVNKIGLNLADLSQQHWGMLASFLGALGSFFSGSATISNLSFGTIQFSIAEQLSLNTNKILALQSVGAAMGNMVCINNIVAVSAILGLKNMDGEILKRTAIVVLLYGILVGVAANVLLT